MKRIILLLAIFQSILVQAQGVVEWPEDTVVAASGDTTYLNPVIFNPIGETEYFDAQGNLTQSTVLISPDTVKLILYYNSGAIKEEYYTKLAQTIDTVTDFNPEWPGHETVRKVQYCENGNVKSDQRIYNNPYEVRDCEGNLWMTADSCNDYFMPIGTFTLLDTLTGQVKEKGRMKTCSYNRLTSCQEGWWDFYENGVLIKREFFEDGWSKKKINYR